MKRPVMVPADYHAAAKRLADKVGIPVGGVFCIALEHHIELVRVIHEAGLGDRPMVAGDLPDLFVQAKNLIAARAARGGIEA